MKKNSDPRVPPALKTWFVIHFAADVLVALPLFFAPKALLSALGWRVMDPFASRLVAAALFGIGIESLLGTGAALEHFKGMLNLKLIWSAAATIGILLGMIDGSAGRPVAAYLVIAVFALFHLLWLYWRVRVGRIETRP